MGAFVLVPNVPSREVIVLLVVVAETRERALEMISKKSDPYVTVYNGDIFWGDPSIFVPGGHHSIQVLCNLLEVPLIMEVSAATAAI